MTIVLVKYPSRVRTMAEPLFIRRDVFQEAENLLKQYANKTVLPELGFGTDLDIEEKKDRVLIKGELPGIKKADLDISIKGDMLTLKGERKEEKEHKKEGLYSYSSSYGQYYRQMSLPAHVDGKKSSFRLTKGKLEIKLPKAEKASNRLIKIKAQAPKKRQLKTAAVKSK